MHAAKRGFGLADATFPLVLYSSFKISASFGHVDDGLRWPTSHVLHGGVCTKITSGDCSLERTLREPRGVTLKIASSGLADTSS
jgi:hypothetical protein